MSLEQREFVGADAWPGTIDIVLVTEGEAQYWVQFVSSDLVRRLSDGACIRLEPDEYERLPFSYAFAHHFVPRMLHSILPAIGTMKMTREALLKILRVPTDREITEEEFLNVHYDAEHREEFFRAQVTVWGMLRKKQ